MKDDSKAKWPESINFIDHGMESDDDGNSWWSLDASEPNRDMVFEIWGNDANQLYARKEQICALPQMVALLKRVMKDSVNEEMLNDTRAVLESIGEVE